MEVTHQLKVELTEARKRREVLQEQVKRLGFCIDVLQKEVAYRTI